MNGIRIMRDLVIVEEIDPPTRIILPIDARKIFRLGKVIGTGPGKRTKTGRSPCDVQTGDTIAFEEAVGLKTKFNGRNYLTIVEKDIMAVVC